MRMTLPAAGAGSGPTSSRRLCSSVATLPGSATRSRRPKWIAAAEAELDEKLEEWGGEDGLLAEVVEGEGDKRRITEKGVKARLKELGRLGEADPDSADERAALLAYGALLTRHKEAKTRLKAAQDALERRVDARYDELTENETETDAIRTLVVEDKWLPAVAAAVRGELDRVSLTLTGRVRQLAERYATPLPRLVDETDALARRVEEHLRSMGAAWI